MQPPWPFRAAADAPLASAARASAALDTMAQDAAVAGGRELARLTERHVDVAGFEAALLPASALASHLARLAAARRGEVVAALRLTSGAEGFAALLLPHAGALRLAGLLLGGPPSPALRSVEEAALAEAAGLALGAMAEAAVGARAGTTAAQLALDGPPALEALARAPAGVRHAIAVSAAWDAGDVAASALVAVLLRR